MTCDEPGCKADALVGLNERNLCIEHFEAALAQIRHHWNLVRLGLEPAP